MKIYFALFVALSVSISIIAGSLLFFLWISEKYDSDSFQCKAAKIAAIWVDVLAALASSYYFINTMAVEIQSHPMMTTALVLVSTCCITAFAINHRTYLPLTCTACILPFIMHGIWFDPADHFAGAGWSITGWAILSILYLCFADILYWDAVKYQDSQHQVETPSDTTEETQDPTAIDVIDDVVERGMHNLGIE